MGDPTSLTESARLLEIAAGKGNAVGHFTLGLHLLEGIGIEKDAHRGVAELLMASFAGSTDAAELFNKYKVTVSEKYSPCVRSCSLADPDFCNGPPRRWTPRWPYAKSIRR